MDFIPKGNPELVLSENPTKIVRNDMTEVEGDAVSDETVGITFVP